ncbi:hypothetical protein ACFOY4_03865 [Actinomadura syzygii]|uniref:Uncharacterized protein n=1 Tax=Actinomadura syzygii TaxID=1427538 RepID=A0A5D0TVV4_9ACTN|nr:hypothetical protein [Actinomadura syzygii]TYC09853.1 hypothetical protein FXF65_32555 [Actinomadura syzygii]
MSDQGLLRLGARMAEVEGACVRVLRASGPREEERELAELAEAASLLAAAARSMMPSTGTSTGASAGTSTGPGTAAGRPRGGDRRPRAGAPERTRLRRRIVRVRRTTEWIISRSGGGPRG